jgi:ribosomal protein L40E
MVHFAMVICGHCQSQNAQHARFCGKCGAPLRQPRDPEKTQAAWRKPGNAGAEAPTLVEGAPEATGAARNPKLAVASKPAAIKPVTRRVVAPRPVGTLPGKKIEPKTRGARDTAIEVEPLIAAEAKARVADRLDRIEAPPLAVWLNFPRALVAGYGSIVEAKVENVGKESLEHLSVMLESNSLAESIEVMCRHIGPGNWTRKQIELTPVKAGNFVLRCNVKSARATQAYAFRGGVPITINVVPDPANFVFNIGDVQCIRGGGGGTGLAAEFKPMNIGQLVAPGAIRSLNDLLNLSFPESYGKVPLELDYEVSQVAISQSAAPKSSAWTIPKPFVDRVQSGTKLRLEPVEGTPEEVRAIHLVARTEFNLGRSRDDADFLTWFWPRSRQNDERTKRLSKVHVTATRAGEKLMLRDAGSANRSTFEGHPLLFTDDDVLGQRGTLILGHEYHVDVAPFDSTLPAGLRIDNGRDWDGPPEYEVALQGAVRFMPINSELALRNAVWIFTDANIGCSRLNAIILDAPGAAEVEGRFHYYRDNFWIEALESGNSIVVDGYELEPRDIVPIVNGSEIAIAGVTFRSAVEP